MSMRQLQQLLAAGRAHWFGVAIFTLIGALAAALLSIALPMTYKASARVFLATPDWNDNTSSATPDGKGRVQAYAFGDEFSQHRAVSYQEMIDSEIVTSAVINQLNLPTTPFELGQRVSARVIPDSVMIDVTARDSTAQGAANVANATAEQFINLIKKLETPSKLLKSPIQPVLLEPAVPPSSPTSPRVLLYLFAGLVLGALVGLTYAAARERIKSAEIPDELLIDDDTLGVLRTGKVPRFVSLDDVGSELAEDVRYTCLRMDGALSGARPDDARHTILFTTPRVGDEVGNVAVLAAAGFAELDRRVAVVLTNFATDEADSSAPPGLGDVLDGRANVARVLRYDEDGRVGLISAGRTDRAPSRALAGPEMDEVLDQLASSFDVTIVIGRPVLESAESLELAGKVAGAVLVCPVPPSTGAEIAESERLLGLTPAASLGRVVVVDPSGHTGSPGVGGSGARGGRKVNTGS